MARDPVVETTENGLGKSEFHGWLFAENEQQRGLKFGYIYIYMYVCVYVARRKSSSLLPCL